MVTEHAADNLTKYAKQIPAKYIMPLLAKMSKAIHSDKSTACVATIPLMKNDYRDDWQANDRIVAIIRHRQVVTVMLSRASQINKTHLRVQRII